MKYIYALIALALAAPAFAQQPVLVTNSGGVDYVHDAALTLGTTAGPMATCRTSNTEPTNATGDTRSSAVWCHRSGAVMGMQRDSEGDDATDTTNNSIRVSLVSGTISSTATTASTTDTALTRYHPSTASTNSVNVKASAGNVYALRAINLTSTVYYLRMYNVATAPTCSSATGFVETIPIPHGTNAGAGFVIPQSFGQGFTTGIGFCITGGSSSTDNTNAAVGVYATVLYK